MAYKIRLIDKDNEIDAFIELFEIVFDKKMTTKLWEWKYLENPMIIDQPLIYIAEHGGKMVGARPLLPNRMKFGDKILKVAQPCDTMVHPEHRRKGLFTKMTKFAIKDAKKRGYTLFYSFPNSLVGKIYKNIKSLDWEILSKIDASYKIFSPEKTVSSKMTGKISTNIAKIVLKLLLSRKSKPPTLKTTKSYDVNGESTITDEFIELWEKLPDDLKISSVRNREYLEWRFVEHPENDYGLFTARKNKELLGYFVTNIVKNRNLVEGRIVDYIIKDYSKEVFLSLLLEALEKFKRERCDLVSTWAYIQPDFQEVLHGYGFIKISSFPYNIFKDTSFFVVRKIVSNYLPVNPLKKENWYITQSDADTY